MESPKIILNASKQPYISSAIHFGGMKFNGYEYKYFDKNDVFVRKDYVLKYKKNNLETFIKIINAM